MDVTSFITWRDATSKNGLLQVSNGLPLLFAVYRHLDQIGLLCRLICLDTLKREVCSVERDVLKHTSWSQTPGGDANFVWGAVLWNLDIWEYAGNHLFTQILRNQRNVSNSMWVSISLRLSDRPSSSTGCCKLLQKDERCWRRRHSVWWRKGSFGHPRYKTLRRWDQMSSFVYYKRTLTKGLLGRIQQALEVSWVTAKTNLKQKCKYHDMFCLNSVCIFHCWHIIRSNWGKKKTLTSIF